jgi:hypothetical protein
VLDDHVPGSRIPSIAIGQRSIEEIFPKLLKDQDRSPFVWVAIDVLSDHDRWIPVSIMVAGSKSGQLDA